MGPAELRALAERNRKEAARLRASVERYSRPRLSAADTLEKLAGELEEAASTMDTPLHKGRDLSIVGKSTMDNDHRIAISRSRSRAAPRDSFSAACRKAKLTQGGLARALSIDPALLSRYRKGKRPIPQERADKVKALTGWPADTKHWPGGIVPLD